MRSRSLLPVLSAALLFLAAVALRKLTGLGWSHPAPALLFASAPLAAVLTMAATRSVPYSRRSLLTAGLLLGGALLAAATFFGDRPQVATLLMNPILIFAMASLLPRRSGWCYTDRGLLFGSGAMAVFLLAAAAVIR